MSDLDHLRAIQARHAALIEATDPVELMKPAIGIYQDFRWLIDTLERILQEREPEAQDTEELKQMWSGILNAMEPDARYWSGQVVSKAAQHGNLHKLHIPTWWSDPL